MQRNKLGKNGSIFCLTVCLTVFLACILSKNAWAVLPNTAVLLRGESITDPFGPDPTTPDTPSAPYTPHHVNVWNSSPFGSYTLTDDNSIKKLDSKSFHFNMPFLANSGSDKKHAIQVAENAGDFDGFYRKPQWTIDMWVYITGSGAGFNVGKRYLNEVNHTIWFHEGTSPIGGKSGDIAVYLRNNDPSRNYDFCFYFGESDKEYYVDNCVDVGNWRHLAVMAFYSAGTPSRIVIRMYVDGVIRNIIDPAVGGSGLTTQAINLSAACTWNDVYVFGGRDPDAKPPYETQHRRQDLYLDNIRLSDIFRFATGGFSANLPDDPATEY